MTTTDPSHAKNIRRAVRNAGPVLVRARLLLSSYAALNLILFARLESAPLKVFCLALALLGLGDGLRLSWLAQEKAAVPRRVATVQDAGPEVAGYLATYLLPLLAAPSPTTGDLFGYGIYGLVVILVWLRSNLAHVNPTLYLLGWRVTHVTFAEGDQNYLISRHVPRPGDVLRVARLSGVLHAK